MREKNKILILGMSEVQAEAIELLKVMGHCVHTCASYIGVGSEISDRYELIDIKDKKRIGKYIINNNIKLIYSVGSELAIDTIIDLSNKLNLKSFYNKDIVNVTKNKILLREYLGKNFKGNIDFQIIENVDDYISLKFPFVIKPNDSQGQRGVYFVRNRDEFSSKYYRSMSYSLSKKLILEKFIDGKEISVNAHILNGKIIFMAVTDRISWNNLEGGIIKKHIIPSCISKITYKRVKSLVYRTIKKLKFDNGPVYFQIKIMNENPYLIEVSPRLDGCHLWRLIKANTNVNILKLALEHFITNDISEINNYLYKEKSYELKFLCKKPNELLNNNDFNIEESVNFKKMYYKEGDTVRPVNGIYEKIGYYIVEK